MTKYNRMDLLINGIRARKDRTQDMNKRTKIDRFLREVLFDANQQTVTQRSLLR